MIDQPSEIITKYLKYGPFEARRITKEETHKNSSELKDVAWKAGEELLNVISDKFYNYPPAKKYMVGSPQYRYFTGLLAEVLKTFQNTFRLAEEGYYRSAFSDLRDLLEIVMRIKYFYHAEEDFNKWIKGQYYTTEDIRDSEFFGDPLTEKIKGFSNTLSANRHSVVFTLDSLGPIITNASYYRKDLFEKWCKHMIMLKDLCLEIVNFEPEN